MMNEADGSSLLAPDLMRTHECIAWAPPRKAERIEGQRVSEQAQARASIDVAVLRVVPGLFADVTSQASKGRRMGTRALIPTLSVWGPEPGLYATPCGLLDRNRFTGVSLTHGLITQECRPPQVALFLYCVDTGPIGQAAGTYDLWRGTPDRLSADQLSTEVVFG